MHLDHVTLAVRDLGAACASFRDALGLIVDSDSGIVRLGSSFLQLQLVPAARARPGWRSYVLGADADVAHAGGVLPTLTRRARPPRSTADHPLGAVGVSAVGVAVRDLSTWEANFSQ